MTTTTMSRTQIKAAAKDVVLAKLMDCEEFGREFVQNINAPGCEDPGCVDSACRREWTSDEVGDIADEVARQAERAIRYLSR